MASFFWCPTCHNFNKLREDDLKPCQSCIDAAWDKMLSQMQSDNDKARYPLRPTKPHGYTFPESN